LLGKVSWWLLAAASAQAPLRPEQKDVTIVDHRRVLRALHKAEWQLWERFPCVHPDQVSQAVSITSADYKYNYDW
jgi:hypothetical protein